MYGFLDVNDVLYRLSHATISAYLRPTSSVGHLEQFVLPTELCYHNCRFEELSPEMVSTDSFSFKLYVAAEAEME